MVGIYVNLFVAGLQGTAPDHTGHNIETSVYSLWQLDNLDSEPHNHK